MPEAAKQSGIALEKTYQFMLWLMPTVEKFPRSQKFPLGDRMLARISHSGLISVWRSGRGRAST